MREEFTPSSRVMEARLDTQSKFMYRDYLLRFVFFYDSRVLYLAVS